MVKRIFSTACLCLALAACSKVSMVEPVRGSGEETAIGFQFNTGNTLKSYTDMQKTGHYNFGVFAYKSTDKVNSVMPNYLVGYCDGVNGYDLKTGSTWGDQGGLEDGKSYWQYEGLGYAEYHGTYAGKALTDAYKSNNPNQYLKYWDNSAAYTCFYAYAPYINGAGTATYVDGTAQSATGSDTYVLTIPNGSLTDGYDDASLSEYMYASAKVEKANYGHDVALQFHRLNAKVNIRFWEDVAGYKVRILDLNSTYGVSAAASIKETGKGDFGYKGGKYYTANGVKIKFNDGAYQSMKQFEGTLAQPAAVDGNNPTPLNFKSPTEAQIGENRYAAVQSPTTYYAIPKGDGANVLADGNTNYNTDQACDADLAKTGFTFHVSYELTAEDTGEKIVVKNATVHVPCEYANWKPNTHYTYIFKITKNSNGTTESTPTIDPTDPEVPTTPALYPIVFDNCTIVDWTENESEWNISDNEGVIYHDIQLDKYSIDNNGGVITITDITNHDTYKDAAIDWTAITVTGPAPATTDVTSWYDNSTHKITVPATAGAGVYTITYTCPATGDQTTHPSKWTETFFVGNAYTLALNQYEAGTKCLADDSKLTITTTKDGSASTPTATQLYIDYPTNFTTEQKAGVSVDLPNMQIVVKNNATAGVYQIVYRIEEGGKSVDVAKKTFEVKDYSFALSHSVVYLGATPVVVNATVPEAAGVISMATTTGITVDDAAKTISVANNTAETEAGYVVTYTLFGSTVSAVQYQQSFKVRNTHSVSVTKNAISKSVGTSQASDYSTDVTNIKPVFNGVATSTDVASSLAILKADKTATTADDFKITKTDNATYKLEVRNGTAAGTYYVEFKSTVAGAPKAEYVGFVVTE